MERGKRMSREILFRGRRLDNGEWVYWNAFGKYTEPFVSEVDMHSHVGECDIDPDTVGQYICQTDKHGRKIFEGDIVSYKGEAQNKDGIFVETEERDVVTMERFPVFWLQNESFGYEGEGLIHENDCTVIGNIHDNPEVTMLKNEC